MKKSNWLLSTIILAIALAMLFFAISCQKQDTEADIAAINEVWNQWTLACNTGDVELLMSLMDDNMVQMPPNAPANIGKEAIRPGEEALLGLFDIELPPMSVEEVEVAGDWGFSRLTFTLSLRPKEGGETSTSSGKALSIFKRQADGSWKVYIDCFNYDAPPKQE